MEASSTQPDRICSGGRGCGHTSSRPRRRGGTAARSRALARRDRVLLVGAVAACFVDRLGAPTLLLFLGLGMLLGEDGPGGITFDDATLVRDAGSRRARADPARGRRARERAGDPQGASDRRCCSRRSASASRPASRRSRPTAALDVHWRTALLVGAVVSSTDAAAVFAAVRNVGLRHRIESVLELESGINDPVRGDPRDRARRVADARRLRRRATPRCCSCARSGSGCVGRRAHRRRSPSGCCGVCRCPRPGSRRCWSSASRSPGYASVARLGGSGLLTAYLIGLAVGDTRIPHAGVVRGFLQGGAWLAQIGLFVLLGLLVTPSRLPHEGLAPLVVALALVLVARPLAVIACTAPFRRRGASRRSSPGPGCAAACRSCSRRSRSPRASRAACGCSTSSSTW